MTSIGHGKSQVVEGSMELILGASPSDISPSLAWPVIGVVSGGIGGAFAFMAHLIADLRAENKALQDKVIDQVIPALQQSTEATKNMIESATRLSEALAVAEDRKRR